MSTKFSSTLDFDGLAGLFNSFYAIVKPFVTLGEGVSRLIDLVN